MIAGCGYRRSDNSLCGEPPDAGSEFCFWHNPSADKSGPDIKGRLEGIHGKGGSAEGFQLENADLEDVYLIKANLRNANLKRARMKDAHLYGSDLSGACLFKAVLENANLKGARLDGADLLGAELETAELQGVRLGPGNRVKNEIEGDGYAEKGEEGKAAEKYSEAEEIYRGIKSHFKNAGLSYESGKYFYREMVARRKQMPYFSVERLFSALMDYSVGYGEKPYRIIGFSFSYAFMFSLAYGVIGISHYSREFMRFSATRTPYENLVVLYESFYYSMVTFATLGYGDYTPVGIGKMFAVFEALTGAFCISLFVITIYKKYMER